MLPDERDEALLYDMLDAARHLRRMWEGRSLDDLLADRTLQWATDRGFSIIGEAARRISDATKARRAGVEWRRIVGLRNVVVHAYNEVDYARHWRVIQEDLPKLIAELEKPAA
jgi:uncharacterized protein with HEPN domain